MSGLVLHLERADLVKRRACSDWLAAFDEVCALRGDDRAPLVRRGGVSRRDPARLRIALSPLAQLWMARDARDAVIWLRENGLMGPVMARAADLRRADLRAAELRRADLRRADLRRADLRRADLSAADLRAADLRDADLSDADLSDADLSDADLRRADLSDAWRQAGDASVPGWRVVDGSLRREVAA